MDEPIPQIAVRCRCRNPLLDGETCLRCGRAPRLMPESKRFGWEGRRVTWTRPKVLRAIEAFAFFRGRPPERDDWNGPMADRWPPLAAVEEIFGSVEAAVRAAGVEPARRAQAVGS